MDAVLIHVKRLFDPCLGLMIGTEEAPPGGQIKIKQAQQHLKVKDLKELHVS